MKCERCANVCFRHNPVFPDVGKALGFEPDTLDALAGNLMWWDGRDAMLERVAEVGLDANTLAVQQLIASQLIGKAISSNEASLQLG